MSADVDTQEILKRLKALEEENARLRKGANSTVIKPLVVTEGEYMGHPTLTFEGPCKPFTLGIKKLSIIQQGWPQVEHFLARQIKDNSALASVDDDKI
jgi:hypothetical protein